MIRTYSVKTESVITTAFVRLRDDLVHRRFEAGEKLPGERELCQLYDVGRSSMRQVLLRLEDERYIERRPKSGTYVREDVASRFNIISLAFVSHDASFDPEQIGIYSWGCLTELLRGSYEEASRHPGIRLTVLHCEDTSEPEKLKHQMEALRHFDGVIFCGFLMQKLKSMVAAEGRPAVVVAPKPDVVPECFPVISYDYDQAVQTLLNLVIGRGKPVVMTYYDPFWVDRPGHDQLMGTLTQCLSAHGIPFECIGVPHTHKRMPDLEGERQLAYFQEACPDLKSLENKVVWVLDRPLLQPVNYLLLKEGIHADVFGFCTSMVLQDFFPYIHYMLIPFCETGGVAVKMLAEFCEEGKEMKSVALKPVHYFGGRREECQG